MITVLQGRVELGNDIATLSLLSDEDRKLRCFRNTIWPACLPITGESYDHLTAIAAGWGDLNTPAIKMVPEPELRALQKTNLEVVSRHTCRQVLPSLLLSVCPCIQVASNIPLSASLEGMICTKSKHQGITNHGEKKTTGTCIVSLCKCNMILNGPLAGRQWWASHCQVATVALPWVQLGGHRLLRQLLPVRRNWDHRYLHSLQLLS
jgi:hypothetical protein